MKALKPLLTLKILTLGIVVACAAAPAVHAQPFIRGDALQDNLLNIGDSIRIGQWLYADNSLLIHPEAADVNDNGVVEIADFVYLQSTLFAGGPVPPAPYPGQGIDTTPPNFPTTPTGNLEFRLGDSVGCPGSQVLLQFRVTSTETMEALSLRLTYDSTLLTYIPNDPAEVLINGQFPGYFGEYVNSDFVSIGMVFNLVSPTLGGLSPQNDTAIFEMVFEIHPSVPNGTVIPINFSDDLSFFPPSVNQGSVLGQAVRADMIGLGTITAFCGGEEFLRGDHNEDSTVSISDVVHLIDFLFTGGPASGCERSGDTNGDEAIDIADAITLVSALFEGSTTIPAPFPVCDVDLVGSPVPCATYAGACP